MVNKGKKVKIISGLQNGAIRGLQIGARGIALAISDRGKKITNRGRDHKSGQEGFQFGAGITNRCRTHGIDTKWCLFQKQPSTGIL